MVCKHRLKYDILYCLQNSAAEAQDITRPVKTFNYESAYQPQNSKLIIPPQLLKSRKIYFQQHWYAEYPWLHYDSTTKSILCFNCAKSSSLGLLCGVKCAEPCFISTGFNNWKKATGKDGRFASHSTCHKAAVQAPENLQRPKNVSTMLSQQLSEEQNTAQKCLKVIFSTVRYLARQGLALRGHDDSEGNFMQLLKCRSSDIPELVSWITQRNSYTHHSIQDEILQLFGSATLRLILRQVQASQSYAVMVDGTQDIQRREQESICLRYVDMDLQPREEFVGFYSVESTTGNQCWE